MEAQAHGSTEGHKSRMTARVTSLGANTRKGGIREAGGQERLQRLFMTVSEKAQGKAKSGLMGGVLQRGKQRKKQVTLLTCPSSPVSRGGGETPKR